MQFNKVKLDFHSQARRYDSSSAQPLFRSEESTIYASPHSTRKSLLSMPPLIIIIRRSLPLQTIKINLMLILWKIYKFNPIP